MRQINQAGLDLVKRFEGLRLDAYRDPAGVWTVGYGHTGAAGPGVTITEAAAEQLLRADLDTAERAVERLIDVPLTDDQFAALVSFTFNVGQGALARSTLRRKLNDGEYAAVPSELARWDKAGGETLRGLARRRQAEADLWRAKPARTSPAQSTTVQASAVQAASAVGTGAYALGALSETAQIIVIAAAVVILLAAVWILRERLKAWAAGWR